MTDKIPITFLTGFLGAGKSTLVRRLNDPWFSDTAVVVTEFGDVGLDGAPITHSPDQVLEMTTGGLCCPVRGDIRDTLLQLHADAELGRMPLFERLVIEITGLADPIPVIATLREGSRLVRRHALAGVVTVVDCLSGANTLAAEEAARQVAVADRIVLTQDRHRDRAGAQGHTRPQARGGGRAQPAGAPARCTRRGVRPRHADPAGGLRSGRAVARRTHLASGGEGGGSPSPSRPRREPASA